MAKYLTWNQSDGYSQVSGTATSTGAADAGKILQANAQGVLDPTLLPPGVGPNLAVIQTTEALAAGDFINIYTDTGNSRCRKAVNDTGKEANGFVLAAVTSGANANIYLSGINNQVSGQTPGNRVFIGATPGAATNVSTTPANGKIHQPIGKALSATSIAFLPAEPLNLIA